MDVLNHAQDNLESKTKAEIRSLCAQFNISIEGTTDNERITLLRKRLLSASPPTFQAIQPHSGHVADRSSPHTDHKCGDPQLSAQQHSRGTAPQMGRPEVSAASLPPGGIRKKGSLRPSSLLAMFTGKGGGEGGRKHRRWGTSSSRSESSGAPSCSSLESYPDTSYTYTGDTSRTEDEHERSILQESHGNSMAEHSSAGEVDSTKVPAGFRGADREGTFEKLYCEDRFEGQRPQKAEEEFKGWPFKTTATAKKTAGRKTAEKYDDENCYLPQPEVRSMATGTMHASMQPYRHEDLVLHVATPQWMMPMHQQPEERSPLSPSAKSEVSAGVTPLQNMCQSPLQQQEQEQESEQHEQQGEPKQVQSEPLQESQQPMVQAEAPLAAGQALAVTGASPTKAALSEKLQKALADLQRIRDSNSDLFLVPSRSKAASTGMPAPDGNPPAPAFLQERTSSVASTMTSALSPPPYGAMDLLLPSASNTCSRDTAPQRLTRKGSLKGALISRSQSVTSSLSSGSQPLGGTRRVRFSDTVEQRVYSLDEKEHTDRSMSVSESWQGKGWKKEEEEEPKQVAEEVKCEGKAEKVAEEKAEEETGVSQGSAGAAVAEAIPAVPALPEAPAAAAAAAGAASDGGGTSNDSAVGADPDKCTGATQEAGQGGDQPSDQHAACHGCCMFLEDDDGLEGHPPAVVLESDLPPFGGYGEVQVEEVSVVSSTGASLDDTYAQQGGGMPQGSPAVQPVQERAMSPGTPPQQQPAPSAPSILRTLSEDRRINGYIDDYGTGLSVLRRIPSLPSSRGSSPSKVTSASSLPRVSSADVSHSPAGSGCSPGTLLVTEGSMTELVERVKTSSMDMIPLSGGGGGTSPRLALTPEASPSKSMQSVPITALSPQRSTPPMLANRSPRGAEHAEGRKELSSSTSSGSSSNGSNGRESIMGSPIGTPRLTSSVIRKARNSNGAANSPAKPVIMRSPLMADMKSNNSSYGSMSGTGSPMSSVSGVGDIRRTGSMESLVSKQELLFSRMKQQQQQYLAPQQQQHLATQQQQYIAQQQQQYMVPRHHQQQFVAPQQQQYVAPQQQQYVAPQQQQYVTQQQQQYVAPQQQQIPHPMHAAPSAANPLSAAAYSTTPYGFPYAGMTMVQMVPLVQMPADQAAQPMQTSQPQRPMHMHAFSPTPPAAQPGFMFVPNGSVPGSMPSPYYMMQVPQGVPGAKPSPSSTSRSMRPSSPMRL